MKYAWVHIPTNFHWNQIKNNREINEFVSFFASKISSFQIGKVHSHLRRCVGGTSHHANVIMHSHTFLIWKYSLVFEFLALKSIKYWPELGLNPGPWAKSRHLNQLSYLAIDNIQQHWFIYSKTVHLQQWLSDLCVEFNYANDSWECIYT